MLFIPRQPELPLEWDGDGFERELTWAMSRPIGEEPLDGWIISYIDFGTADA